VTLDDDWWLNIPEVTAWPDEVVSHLREHRRPITTIPIGRSDISISAEQQEHLRTRFDGVCVIDGDYFLPLLRPDVVAEIIVETFVTVS